MRKKILLIDDEPAICKFTKLNLERSGKYEVTVATSGEEGLRKAESTDFSLVITDFRMPGMDGAAVLQALKEKNAKMPVVLFSVYHDDTSEITEQVKQAADGIISKPIDRDELNKIIESTLSD